MDTDALIGARPGGHERRIDTPPGHIPGFTGQNPRVRVLERRARAGGSGEGLDTLFPTKGPASASHCLQSLNEVVAGSTGGLGEGCRSPPQAECSGARAALAEDFHPFLGMLGSERRFYGYGPAGGDGRSDTARKSGPSGQVEALLAAGGRARLCKRI